MRILIIEDDARAADYLVGGLRERGHDAEWAKDGLTGLERASRGDYDALVIDRMMPGLDGLEMLKRLRAMGCGTPALFLTALDQVDHRVEGLRAGAEDYLVKPYAFPELLARVEGLARRRAPEETITKLRLADLEMDLLARTVTRAGDKIELQPREFKLLEELLRHSGQVVTRSMLLESVWDYHFDPQTNVIDVHISRLRSKIDKGYSPSLLRTVRGAGYMLAADGDA